MASIGFDTVIFPPENTLPADQTVGANTDLALSGLSIFAYLDATAVNTTLSVLHGTLTVAAIGGALVSGSGTDTVTLSGSAKQINAALTALDNVVYHGAQDFFGIDTLTVVTDDGYGWPIGPQSDTDQMSINVGKLPAMIIECDTPVMLAPPGTQVAANGFDAFYYLQHNPDVAAAGVDPYEHFQQFGWREGRNPNAFFDTAGYLDAYADVKAAGVNPFDHYNAFGWHEGRDPSAGFDTTAYLAAYADVAAAHVNPLLHFLQFGIGEGRSGFADGVWG